MGSDRGNSRSDDYGRGGSRSYRERSPSFGAGGAERKPRQDRARRQSRDRLDRARHRRTDRPQDSTGGNDRGGLTQRDYRKDRSEDDSAQEREKPRRERRYKDRSRSRERSYQRSSSPSAKNRRSQSPSRRSRAPLPSQQDSFKGDVAPGKGAVEKQKPNFKPTGLLAREANTVAGTTTVLKYHEPPEARKPKEQWRIYVFKKKDLLDTVHLYQRSAWLTGRDQRVTDFLIEHPSVSKQHAVIQFRHITSTNEYGDRLSKVKPYLIDLDSANGTKLNGEKIEASKYIELIDQDVISFGDSEREYVMMKPSVEK